MAQEASVFGKLVWAVILIVSISFMSFQIEELVTNYQNRRWISNTFEEMATSKHVNCVTSRWFFRRRPSDGEAST